MSDPRLPKLLRHDDWRSLLWQIVSSTVALYEQTGVIDLEPSLDSYTVVKLIKPV